MTLRIVAASVLTCALICGAISAASARQRLASPPPREESMTFYIAKGAPDACGRDCDTWIEAEGKVEADTTARLKTFLNRVHGRNLPIYFSSPGGNLDQAIAMGSLLHDRPTIARVGRTTVRECGFEAQDSDVCLKLKQSGRELHGDLFTNGAVCASACPYAFVGAAVHEVAPDAILAIHSPKIVLSSHGGQPDVFMIAAANRRGRERADRVAGSYLTKMGIDPGLLALTRTVKFEEIHILTRDEIARFGLDRREFVETSWRFESNTHSMVRKIAVMKGETSFRLLQWRVACFDSDNFVLDFQRPIPPAGIASVALAHDGASAVYFQGPARGSGIEQWSMRLIGSRMNALVDHHEIKIIETSVAADGRLVPRPLKLSNDGWSGAIETLVAGCPLSKLALTIQRSSQASKANEATAK